MGHGYKGFRFGPAIVRRYVPILNAAYPADVSKTFSYGGSTSATFQVAIQTDGYPAEYTYQWYVDGIAVEGATSTTFTKSAISAEGTHSVFCRVSSAAGYVDSRIATLTVKCNNYTLLGSTKLDYDDTKKTSTVNLAFFETARVAITKCSWVKVVIYVKNSSGTTLTSKTVANSEYTNKTVDINIASYDVNGYIQITASGESSVDYVQIGSVTLIS